MLVVLLAIMALVDAFGVLASVDELAIADRLLDDEDVPQREIDVTYDRWVLSGILQTVTILVIVVAWLTWFRRAYAGVPLMGAGADRRFNIRWAVGSWFVPILNLWRPKQITNDVWRATEPDPGPAVEFSSRPVPKWLALWWAGWLAMIGASVLCSFVPEDTLEQQRTFTLVTLVSNAAWIVVDLLALAVVVAITRRWDARRAVLLASRGA